MGLPECLGRSEISKIYPEIAPILDVWLEPGNFRDKEQTRAIGEMVFYYLKILNRAQKSKISLRGVTPKVAVGLCRNIFEDVCFLAAGKKEDARLSDHGFVETLAVKGQRYPQEGASVKAAAGLVFVFNTWGENWESEEVSKNGGHRLEEYAKTMFSQAMLDFAQEILNRKSSLKQSLE